MREMAVCTARLARTSGHCSAIISDKPASWFKASVHEDVKSLTIVRICHNGDPRGGYRVSAYIFGRPDAGHSVAVALFLCVCLIVPGGDASAVKKGTEPTSGIAKTSVVTALSTNLLEG